MFTLLSWAAFPSSFIVTPLANRVVMALDVTNIKVIDLVVAATVVASGYVQWFVFPAVISVRTKGNR